MSVVYLLMIRVRKNDVVIVHIEDHKIRLTDSGGQAIRLLDVLNDPFDGGVAYLGTSNGAVAARARAHVPIAYVHVLVYQVQGDAHGVGEVCRD